MPALSIICSDCGIAYPEDSIPFRCQHCGGVYDYDGPFCFDRAEVDDSLPGIWKYRSSFHLPSDLEPVSLGEGNTPLVWSKVLGRKVAFKCEFLNPSGSFKDRGSALITAFLRWQGANNILEDSSGNAGASLAAYAARAGIKARIFVPASASGAKRKQIAAYGAELVPISGSRAKVTEAALKEAEAGSIYASHAYLPFNLPGYATAAYEIFEQLGKMPGAVLVPAGQGGLLLGLARGFRALRIANPAFSFPELIGVQASACAPLWAKADSSLLQPEVLEKNTLAEGVRVLNPLRMKAVIAEVIASGGQFCVTGEEEILPGQSALAGLGFYVEPTSAIIWGPLIKKIKDLPDPVVVILTGSGLKSG